MNIYLRTIIILREDIDNFHFHVPQARTHLCRRFTAFVTKYNLMSKDNLIVPMGGAGGGGGGGSAPHGGGEVVTAPGGGAGESEA